jgi:hypothetical protein
MTPIIQAGSRLIRINGRLLRVARLDAEKFRFVDDPEPVVQDLRRSGARVDLFTFMQRLPEMKPKHSFHMEWDNLAVIPLSSFENWWNKQIGFKGRNKAKQAEKRGVILREVSFDDELVRGIWQIYNECPIRQGKPFSHFGKDLETVRKEEATYLESSIFIGAFLEGRLIGFVKLLCDETGTQAGLLNIVSMIAHRDKSPTNALVVEAVRACTKRNIPHLVYSNFAYGNKQQDSLSDFKERNGFQRVEVPRYYVPLSRLGAAALSMGLHHKFTERLPESWTAKLREYRNAWYSRKFQSATQVS